MRTTLLSLALVCSSVIAIAQHSSIYDDAYYLSQICGDAGTIGTLDTAVRDKIIKNTEMGIDMTNVRAAERSRKKVNEEWQWVDKFCSCLNSDDPTVTQELVTTKPENFEFLQSILQHEIGTLNPATLTSGLPFLGDLAIDQSSIILGITQWSFNRAQQELLKAFLQDWINRIQDEAILADLFPSTLDLLGSTEFTTIITQGETWKAAFVSDLEGIPDRAPQIVRTGLSYVPEDRLKSNVKEEIYSLTDLSTEIYQAALQSKPIDDVIRNYGERIFLQFRAGSLDTITITERALIATSMSLNTMLKVDQSGNHTYLTLDNILSMGDGHFKAFWFLAAIQNGERIRFIGKAADYGHSTSLVQWEIPKARVQALQWVDKAQSLRSQLKPATNAFGVSAAGAGFTIENFPRYLDIILDWVDSGVEFTEGLGIVEDQEIIQVYRRLGRPIADDLKYISEGVAMKEYGKIVTGVIDLLTKILEEQNSARSEELLANLEKLQNALEGAISNENSRDAVASVNNREAIAARMADVKLADFGITDATMEAEVKSMLDDFKLKDGKAEKDANKLVKRIVGMVDGSRFQSLVEDVNMYGNFMVNVLTAESDEEVSSAFENAALSVGSYKIKMTSSFSATLSVMPGFEAGIERNMSDALPNFESQGVYVGATLPIGIDLSLGSGGNFIGAYSLFLQALDLGAILNYSISNDNDSLQQIPEIGFRQILSPGAHFMIHTANAPIVFGIGASYSPELRGLSVNNPDLTANAWQFGITFGVDVTAFQFYASKKKNTDNFRSYDSNNR